MSESFARYFAAVQQTEVWQAMQLGMADFGNASPGKRVLDVGSGPGRLVAELRQRGVRAVGLDGDPQMGRRSRAVFGRLPMVLARAEQLPFAAQSFDTILAGNILFFLPNPVIAIREMVRLCRPGGYVVNWSPSERMSKQAAELYVSHQKGLDEFSKTHLVNWAQVAENNRRWSADDLAILFAEVGLTAFSSETTLGGLARYSRGQYAGRD